MYRSETVLNIIFILVVFYKSVECFNIMEYIIFKISHRKVIAIKYFCLNKKNYVFLIHL